MDLVFVGELIFRETKNIELVLNAVYLCVITRYNLDFNQDWEQYLLIYSMNVL